MSLSPQSSRKFWPDFIRALAIAGVVMIHTTSPLINRYGQIPAANWWTGLLVGTLVRTTVLLFFMLTGALYLGRDLVLLPFLKKRAVKILIPFFFWGMIYDYHHWLPFSLDALWHSLLRVLQENTSGHLWFFYTLIGLYLFLPVLNLFVQKADETHLRYYLILWFTVTALFPLLDRLTEIYPGFDLRMMAGYSGYLVLGYWLSRMDITSSRLQRAAALFAAGFLGTAGSVAAMSHAEQNINAWALGYLTPQIIIMAGSLFYLLRAWGEHLSHHTASARGQIIRMLSQASFGIYLVHFIFIRLLARADITPFTLGPAWIAIPLFWALVMALSLAFTLIWQKIPLLRYLVP